MNYIELQYIHESKRDLNTLTAACEVDPAGSGAKVSCTNPSSLRIYRVDTSWWRSSQFIVEFANGHGQEKFDAVGNLETAV